MKKILLLLLIGFITACTSNTTQLDLTTWGEEEVYDFLNKVQENIRKLPTETNSINHIIEQYELFFSPELSKKIVDSLYEKTGDVWRVPEGDAGYIFFVLGKGSEDNEVTIEYSKEYIKIKETYESGMFKEIEFTIRIIDKKPKITEWKRVFD